MKITVNVEATAQEMRDFLGLPNVQPLQDEMMDAIRDNMRKGSGGFDPMSVMRVVFPGQIQSMEALQRTFWEAFTQANSEEDDKSKKEKK